MIIIGPWQILLIVLFFGIIATFILFIGLIVKKSKK